MSDLLVWEQAEESHQILLVTPWADCKVARFIAGWIGVAAVLLSSSLFLCRVNSVFYGSLRAKVLFSCMWLLSAIGAVVYPSHYTAAAPTPPYALCAIKSVKRFAFLSLLPMVIFDWVVFGAISARVITVFAPHTHWRGMCKIFTTGEDIGVIPRVLLRTGQLYFL